MATHGTVCVASQKNQNLVNQGGCVIIQEGGALELSRLRTGGKAQERRELAPLSHTGQDAIPFPAANPLPMNARFFREFLLGQTSRFALCRQQATRGLDCGR